MRKRNGSALFPLLGGAMLAAVSLAASHDNDFDAAFERGFVMTADGEYGVTAEKPIRVGAPRSSDQVLLSRVNRTRYLLSLRGPNDEKVKYMRLGSCCHEEDANQPFGRAPLDVFEVMHKGLDEPVKLYFSVYSYSEPRIPKGFTFRPTQKKDENDVLQYIHDNWDEPDDSDLSPPPRAHARTRG
jgi:hypothetical protein